MLAAFLAGVFRAVAFFDAVFFAAVLFAPVLTAELPVLARLGDDRVAAVFFATVFFAIVFLAVVFRDTVFFAAAFGARVGSGSGCGSGRSTGRVGRGSLGRSAPACSRDAAESACAPGIDEADGSRVAVAEPPRALSDAGADGAGADRREVEVDEADAGRDCARRAASRVSTAPRAAW